MGGLRPGLLALLAGVLAQTAPAQSAPDRSALEKFRDSLGAAADSSALRRLEKRIGWPGARDSTAALREIRRGLVLLRIGELGDGWSFGRAAKVFAGAERLAPDWPYPSYARGLAEAGEGEWLASDSANLGTRVGSGARIAAVRAMQAALQREPDFTPALLALSRLALELRDTTLLQQAALPALRRVAARGPIQDPCLLLAWGRIEREVGSPELAVGAFRSYLAAGRPGLGRLELARTLLAQGSSEGEDAYFEGAASDDSLALAGYRADLALIADSAELAEFAAAGGEARVAFLHRFWTRRAQRDLRPAGERLQEHYRRIAFARRHFSLLANRRYYGWNDPYRSGSLDYDDRGLIYIRQGEPTQRVAPRMFGLMPNESWRYARPDGDLLFHFSGGGDDTGGGDLQDYRLVNSVYDLRSSGAPVDMLVLSREPLSDWYGKLLTWGPYGSARVRARERAAVSASIALGTRTDRYLLRYPRVLPATTNLIALGPVAGGSLVHVLYAIPAGAGDSAGIPAGEPWPVRLRFAAFDSSGVAVATADSTVRLPVHPGPGSTSIAGRFAIAVPSGQWTYRMALEIGSDAGILFPADSISIEATDGTAFSMSDLAIGSPDRSVVWHPTPAEAVLLQPVQTYARGTTLDLYYQVYGLGAGERFRTELRLLPRRGNDFWHKVTGRPAAVSLGFESEAAGPLAREHRGLDLGPVKPGEYWLEARVFRGDGAEADRRRLIRVVAD